MAIDARRQVVAVLLAALSLGGHAAVASAACDVTYTGPVDGSWASGPNWSTNVPPAGNQAACIPAGKGTIAIAGVAATAKTLTAASGVHVAGGASLALSDATAGFPNAVAALVIEAGGTVSTPAGSGVALTGFNRVDGTLAGNARLDGGSLAGTGTIGGALQNVAGAVLPGNAVAVGALHVGGAFNQQAGGTLYLDLASDTSFDQIVGPNFNHYVDGTIVVTVLPGYTPAVGTTWDFIPPPGFGTSVVAQVTPPEFSAYPIPQGSQLRLNGAIPTTTTTSVPSTSTTAVATSTTTPGSVPATTTTTLPGSCDGPREATFVSIDCRLDALIATLTAATDVPAKLKTALLKQLTAARSLKQRAEQTASTKVTRGVLGALQHARRDTLRFSHRVRSLAGRRGIPVSTAGLLTAAGDDISADLKTLRSTLRASTKKPH